MVNVDQKQPAVPVDQRCGVGHADLVEDGTESRLKLARAVGLSTHSTKIMTSRIAAAETAK